jgi:hypothetical protein
MKRKLKVTVMPRVKFSTETIEKPCPHHGIHGVHQTRDGRQMGLCQIGDDHLKRLEAFLRHSLDQAYHSIGMHRPGLRMLESFSHDTDQDIGRMEDKLRLVVAEKKRRKDAARLATNHQA